MAAPIFHCISGHSICSKCRDQLHLCPTCRQRYEDTRNFVLEKMGSNTMYPSNNRDKGCSIVLIGLAIRKHETVRCKKIWCTSEPCSWNGKRSYLLDHLRLVHNLQDEKLITIDTSTIFGTSYLYREEEGLQSSIYIIPASV